MPLNQMTVETHVTTIQDPSTVSYYPDDGVFVHGLILEGARWSTLDEINERYPVGSSPPTECGGTLLDSNPKELLWGMPVVYVKAVTTSPTWEPSSVGYLRHDPNIYECPVYLTRFRGHTYIFWRLSPPTAAAPSGCCVASRSSSRTTTSCRKLAADDSCVCTCQHLLATRKERTRTCMRIN